MKLLRDPFILDDLGGISDVTLWRYRRDGLMPKPRKLRGRNVTPADEYEKAKRKLLDKTI